MTTNAKFCPHCGEPQPETEASFCEKCGSPVIVLDSGIPCARCQGIIQDTDLYCMHCQHFTSSDA